MRTLLIGLLLSTSACSSVGFGAMTGSEHGILELRGDARGIEAYHQGIQGMVEVSKNPEGRAPSIHAVYQHKEEQRTTRRNDYVSPFGQFLGLSKPQPRFNGGS